MINEDLIKLFERDLQSVIAEVNNYRQETNLWLCSSEIKNSGGNLVLHICGNLKHFIGAVLGQSGYIRDRHAEFNDKNVSKTDLIINLKDTMETVNLAIGKLDAKQLNDIYPIEVFAEPMSARFFLLHLSTHLNYHLGQINYHRRILDKN